MVIRGCGCLYEKLLLEDGSRSRAGVASYPAGSPEEMLMKSISEESLLEQRNSVIYYMYIDRRISPVSGTESRVFHNVLVNNELKN